MPPGLGKEKVPANMVMYIKLSLTPGTVFAKLPLWIQHQKSHK